MLPPNPSELMMSGSLASLLQQLSTQYDYVIVDTPPVLVASDTAAIAAQAGTLLLVARAGQTQIGELHECAKRLMHAGKGVTGVLLNALDVTRRHYGSYGYKQGYRYRQYSYVQGR
jgi:tyrosine-protein kinase Etk/Wzc